MSLTPTFQVFVVRDKPIYQTPRLQKHIQHHHTSKGLYKTPEYWPIELAPTYLKFETLVQASRILLNMVELVTIVTSSHLRPIYSTAVCTLDCVR